MARTRATIEMELAKAIHMRFMTRLPEVKDQAHERIMELRAELADLRAAKARQKRKAAVGVLTAWVISFHGLDYESVIALLDDLPKRVAAGAKIFTCFDESKQPAVCVAYDEPRGTVQEDGSKNK